MRALPPLEAPTFSMEQFLFENSVETLRARELKNLLIQKLGVDPALIRKIVDRAELKEMVVSIVYEKFKEKSRAEYIAMSYKVAIVVGVLTLVYFSRDFILGCFVSIYEMLGESSYKSVKKSKLLMYNIKRWNYLAAMALLVSLMLELAVAWIQLSILLSWVISRDSIIRGFMLPTLSFPVSANTIANVASGKGLQNASQSTSVAGTLGSYSLDVGPMLTIMAINFIVGRLDNYAAGVVLEHKRRKDERRTRRFYEAHPGKGDGDSVEVEGEDRGGDDGKGPAAGGSGVPLKPSSRAGGRIGVRSDAEIIDDSLNAFFGRGRLSAENNGSSVASKHSDCETDPSNPTAAGSDNRNGAYGVENASGVPGADAGCMD